MGIQLNVSEVKPRVTISLEEYEFLKETVKCHKTKTMYVSDIHYQNRQYFTFNDVQKNLVYEIERLSDMNKSNYKDYLKDLNDLKGRTFTQKLKNLFK
jgi:hypothetical protein